MPVTTKYSTQLDGSNLLSVIIEADGATELASEAATVSAKATAYSRTVSGGIAIDIVVNVKEPEIVVGTLLNPNDEAVAYFVAKGFTPNDAQSQVDRFGVSRVLNQRDKEIADKQKEADLELTKELQATILAVKK